MTDLFRDRAADYDDRPVPSRSPMGYSRHCNALACCLLTPR